MNRLGAWRLLSGDRPGHRVVAVLLLVLLLALLGAPFQNSSGWNCLRR